MMDKLREIDARYDALVSQLEDPATYANPELLRRLTREQKEIEPVAEAYRAYRRAEDDLGLLPCAPAPVLWEQSARRQTRREWKERNRK